MIVAEIDKDYLDVTKDLGPEYNRVGHKFEMLGKVPAYREGKTVKVDVDVSNWPKVRWRTKDDDDDLCYGGWLLNDSEGEVQLEVLRYCMADVGATIIEIKGCDKALNVGWVQEIG